MYSFLELQNLQIELDDDPSYGGVDFRVINGSQEIFFETTVLEDTVAEEIRME